MTARLAIETSGRSSYEFFVSGIPGGGGYGKFSDAVSIQIHNASSAKEARRILREWLTAIGANAIQSR